MDAKRTHYAVFAWKHNKGSRYVYFLLGNKSFSYDLLRGAELLLGAGAIAGFWYAMTWLNQVAPAVLNH